MEEEFAQIIGGSFLLWRAPGAARLRCLHRLRPLALPCLPPLSGPRPRAAHGPGSGCDPRTPPASLTHRRGIALLWIMLPAAAWSMVWLTALAVAAWLLVGLKLQAIIIALAHQAFELYGGEPSGAPRAVLVKALLAGV